MGVFRFEAVDSSGKLERGSIEADSVRQARAVLRTRGLLALTVVGVNSPGAGGGLRWFGRSLSGADRLTLIRQLASLLSAGVPLGEALAAMAAESERSLVRQRVMELRSEVLGGSSLAAAMARHGREFPPIFQALVAAGEQSGKLGWVLERLADYVEQRAALGQKVLMAMVYPAIVTTVALGIVIFLMTTVVPQVVAVFISNHQALPLLTRIMVELSKFLREQGLWMLGALLLTGLTVRWALRQPPIRQAWDERLLRLPLIGKLVRGYNTERFASTLSILVGGGVPILTALQGAADTISNRALERDVADAIVRVREGSSLARALGAQRRFPVLLVQLIHSGEATGRLPEMLERAARTEATTLERRILLFTTLLEPALILGMGLMVALIVLAVLMPIIEINQMVR